MDCLCLVCWDEAGNGFYFDNYLILDKKIRSVVSDLLMFVNCTNWILTLKSNPSEIHLLGGGFFINRLQESWSQNFVDLYGGPDDLLCQVFKQKHDLYNEQILSRAKFFPCSPSFSVLSVAFCFCGFSYVQGFNDLPRMRSAFPESRCTLPILGGPLMSSFRDNRRRSSFL